MPSTTAVIGAPNSQESLLAPEELEVIQAMNDTQIANVLCKLGEGNLPRDSFRVDLSQMTTGGEPIENAPKIDIWVYATDVAGAKNSYSDALATLITVTKEEEYRYIVRGNGFQPYRDYSGMDVPDVFKPPEISEITETIAASFDDLSDAIEQLVALAKEFEASTVEQSPEIPTQ